jgi:hypothetical protein
MSTVSTTGFGGRPTDAVLNDVIREIDTQLKWRWNGSAWQLAEPWRKKVLLAAANQYLLLSGIPKAIHKLSVGYHARGNNAGEACNVLATINGDGTAQYFGYHFAQLGSTAAAPTATIDNAQTSAFIGVTTALASGSAQWGGGRFDIQGLNSGLEKPNFEAMTVDWSSAPNNMTLFWTGHLYNVNNVDHTSVRLEAQSSQFITGSWIDAEGWD